MNVQPGWIKLYKQTLDSDFWLDPEPFSHRSAFIHVLLSANWRQGVSRRNGHKVTIKRGQWLTSIRKLMDTFHWSKNRVYRWLQAMKDYEMIESENLGFGTLLTVVNYDKYQVSPDTDGHRDGHTDGHTVEDTDGHRDGTRSKNKDIRQQKEDSISACAEEPAAPDPEDDDDEGWMSPEEAIRLWESTHSDAKKPLN